MSNIDVAGLRKMLDDTVTQWAAGVSPTDAEPSPANELTEAKDRKLPEGKRVVRTKTSGDRVYLLDEEKQTRQWVTNVDVLKKLGFELSDVTEVDDNELLKFQMGQALYRVD